MKLRWLAAMVLFASSPSDSYAGPVTGAVNLAVPVVEQSREKCGPAALEMVLRYFGAGSDAIAHTATAYDPALRGSLITDLATSARRAGYDAAIVTISADSLAGLLAEGIPPILLYQNGRGPLTVRHFGVVRGWDPVRQQYALNDGGARPRHMSRSDLEKRWRTAGGQTLVIRRRVSESDR